MDPKRWVRSFVGILAVCSAIVAAAPAHAQFYDDTRRSLDLGPDPLARSPRMVGMGGLSLALEDVHHRYDVWEFSANPAALMQSDTVSSFELYPGTTARNTLHDEPVGGSTRERQDFALREFRTGYEGWRRSKEGASFGVTGDFNRLRTDTPQATNAELRSQFSMPRTSLVISGRMPFIMPQRLSYGLMFTHRYEARADETHGLFSNAVGDYIDKNGVTLSPIQALDPSHYGIRSVGVRFGVLLRATPWLKVGGAYDYLGHSIEGRNDAVRNTSEIREQRPYGTYTASAAGHFAGLKFVGDASRWSTGKTDQTWVVSYSTGTGQPPIAGRGLFQRRDETGGEVRGRVSYTVNAVTLSAGGGSYHRDVTTTAPAANDLTSFNHFLNVLSARSSADSLSLPDSLLSNASKEQGTEFGFGGAYKLPWRAAVLGAEYHTANSTLDQLIAGQGPQRQATDIRMGLEVPMNDRLQLRGGYDHRKIDNDKHLSQDEFVSNAVTSGFGYTPHASSWRFDFGYQVRWGRADFGDPTRVRTSEQTGLCRVRWVF